MKNDIKFDFNNMMAHAIGSKHGVAPGDIKRISAPAKRAFGHLQKIIASDRNRVNIGLEWVRLPFQDRKFVNSIQRLGDEISSKYENVISLGIGGSYLGLKAA